MSVVHGIIRFVYDFVIGDDWKIAAGVVTGLTTGLILLYAGLPASAVVVTTAILIGAAFTLALAIDARHH